MFSENDDAEDYEVANDTNGDDNDNDDDGGDVNRKQHHQICIQQITYP